MPLWSSHPRVFLDIAETGEGVVPLLRHALSAGRRPAQGRRALTRAPPPQPTRTIGHATSRADSLPPRPHSARRAVVGRRRDPVGAARRAASRAGPAVPRRRAGARLVRARLRAHARRRPHLRFDASTWRGELARDAARSRGHCPRRATRRRSSCRIRGNRRSCPGSPASRAAPATWARCAGASSTIAGGSIARGCRGSSTATPRSRRARAGRAPAARAPLLVPDAANRDAALGARARPRSPRRHPLPRRRVRSRQAVAGGTFREPRAKVSRRRHAGVAAGLAERQGRRRRRTGGDGGRRRRDPRSVRPHRPRHRDRPPVARRDCRQQRLGADARGRSGERPARRAVRLVVARVHAADVGRGEHRAHRHRLQPVLQARMSARALQVHARSRPRRGV